MSLQLFVPTSSASRRSADWSQQVSGQSVGVGTKAGLFLFDAKCPCCLGLIGNENLLVCGKPVIDRGTSHQGGKFEPTEEMADMVNVRDPKLATRFLKNPVAERACFWRVLSKLWPRLRRTCQSGRIFSELPKRLRNPCSREQPHLTLRSSWILWSKLRFCPHPQR
jgi:hypothetical protein